MNDIGPALSTIPDNKREPLSRGLPGKPAEGDAPNLQHLAGDFTAVATEFEKTRDAAKLERLRELRLRIADALIALAAPVGEALVPPLNAMTISCLKSGIRSLPRTPAEDDLFNRCRSVLASAPPDRVAAPGLAALLLAWHAFELESVPPLTAMPRGIRSVWLALLLETPQAFVQAKDGDRFAHYLEQLCDRIQECLRATTEPVDDIVAGFFGSAAFVQSYFNELNLRDLMRSRGLIIEDILERSGATLDQLRVMRPCRRRPRIGFIALHIADGTEGALLAAYMERLDRRRFDIRLYSVGAPAGKLGALCRAVAETYVQLPAQVAAAVARLRREALDVAILTTNLTAVPHLLTQIAAHRIAPVQATTGASPVTTGLRNMDLMISGDPNEAEDSSAHYTERLASMPAAINCYAFPYMLEGLLPPDPIARAAHGIPENAVLFFSAANFYKILPELSEQWFRILAQIPNSYLMLMPFNPNWSRDYPLTSFHLRLQRQMAEAGLTTDRIRLHPPVPTIAHLHKVMELADVYLDAFPFSGACSIYDALQAGMPVVARSGKVCRSLHSKAILEEAGLRDWVTSDAAGYVNRALELGRDPKKRAAERERLAQILRAGFKLTDTAGFAAVLMPLLDGVLSTWNAHVDDLHALTPTELAQRLSQLLAEAEFGPFTDRDLVVRVVLPYLRNGGSRRLIDVGACMGAMTRPFLEEGWQSVMFEPDERCHASLVSLLDAFPGQARLEKSAVTADRDGSIPFHVAGAPGLSGLSHSPFAADLKMVDVGAVTLGRYITGNGLFDVDFIKIDAEGHDLAILDGIDFDKVAPRLVMVEFGEQFAGQDRSSVEAALRRMKDRGYRACVICSRAVGQLERHEWQTTLLAIGLDAVPTLPEGLPLFGNILFFRNDDRDFLPSLCDWLEQRKDWKERGLLWA